MFHSQFSCKIIKQANKIISESQCHAHLAVENNQWFCFLFLFFLFLFYGFYGFMVFIGFNTES